MDGFDKMVEESWKSMNIDDNNGLVHLKKKLQCLKHTIRTWIKDEKARRNVAKVQTQNKLYEIDRLLDQGGHEAPKKQERWRWSIEGDENTKYFHGILNKKRSKLSIRGVLVDVEEQVEELEWEVSYEEVKKAVWDCGENKSPGPDGYTFEFFCRFWKLLDRDIFEAVKCFISTDLISDVQSAFIANRQILDGSFILNELISWCKFKKFKAMVFKVDFKKAYDSVSRIMQVGLFSGISINNSLQLSHLLYADDAVFVGEWNDSNLATIVHVLKCFFLASSLKINMHKSKLMGTGVGLEEVSRAANIVGCSTLSSPFSYLGVKVGDCMSRLQTWNDVTSKIMSRLSRWKLKTLSIGGRLTLLKSVLSSTPLYQMSIFKVPKGVLKNLESLRCKFFHGAEGSDRKMSWFF
ncbi:hypothetical protein Tco_0052324 [Tanacetum coccineum]